MLNSILKASHKFLLKKPSLYNFRFGFNITLLSCILIQERFPSTNHDLIMKMFMYLLEIIFYATFPFNKKAPQKGKKNMLRKKR